MVISETPEGDTWLSRRGLWALETGVGGGLGEPKTQLGRISQSSELGTGEGTEEERVSLGMVK